MGLRLFPGSAVEVAALPSTNGFVKWVRFNGNLLNIKNNLASLPQFRPSVATLGRRKNPLTTPESPLRSEVIVQREFPASVRSVDPARNAGHTPSSSLKRLKPHTRPTQTLTKPLTPPVTLNQEQSLCHRLTFI